MSDNIKRSRQIDSACLSVTLAVVTSLSAVLYVAEERRANMYSVSLNNYHHCWLPGGHLIMYETCY